MKKQEGHYTIKRFDFYENLPKQGNANWLYLLEDGSTYIWNQDSKKYEDITIGISNSTGPIITNTSQLINDGEDGVDLYALQSQIPDLTGYMDLTTNQTAAGEKIFTDKTSVNSIIVDENNTTNNIAGSVITVKKESDSSGTNVAGFLDVNRDNSSNTTAETYGQINRVVNNSDFDNEGIVGANNVGRHSGSGSSNYTYGVLNTAEYLGSGDIEFLISDENKAKVSGTGSGTINFVRGGSIDISNPNVVVNNAQCYHPSLSLSSGTLVNGHVMYLDADYIGGNITGEFAYIRSGIDSDVVSALNGNSNAYYINSEVNLPSTFAGKLTTTAPTSSITEGGDYVTLDKLSEFSSSTDFADEDGNVQYSGSVDKRTGYYDTATETYYPDIKAYKGNATVTHYGDGRFVGGNQGLENIQFSVNPKDSFYRNLSLGGGGMGYHCLRFPNVPEGSFSFDVDIIYGDQSSTVLDEFIKVKVSCESVTVTANVSNWIDLKVDYILNSSDLEYDFYFADDESGNLIFAFKEKDKSSSFPAILRISNLYLTGLAPSNDPLDFYSGWFGFTFNDFYGFNTFRIRETISLEKPSNGINILDENGVSQADTDTLQIGQGLEYNPATSELSVNNTTFFGNSSLVTGWNQVLTFARSQAELVLVFQGFADITAYSIKFSFATNTSDTILDLKVIGLDSYLEEVRYGITFGGQRTLQVKSKGNYAFNAYLIPSLGDFSNNVPIFSVIEEANFQQSENINTLFDQKSFTDKVTFVETSDFLNGWNNLATNNSLAGYFKKGNRIYLTGNVTGGSLGDPIFTLPLGYRPTKTVITSVIIQNIPETLYITTNGNVFPFVGGNTTGWVSLTGISFLIE